MYIENPLERAWIQEYVEVGYPRTPREEQLRILRKLNSAEAFEAFLQTKYVGQKRFSLEGGETLIPLLDAIISAAADRGLDEVCIGMPHRGRLNVLANIVESPMAKFSKRLKDITPRIRSTVLAMLSITSELRELSLQNQAQLPRFISQQTLLTSRP